jgi:uncharacterized protein (UPF0548 family)
VFFLSTPSDDEVRRILSGVAEEAFNYPHVGVTQERLRVAPTGYRLSSYGTALGVGEAVFDRACSLLGRFGNYPSSFTRVVSCATAVDEGVVFGTLATHFGFASLHPCRVIRLIGTESPRRFGFALGTLPGHMGAGEECFVVTLGETDRVVRYEVQAISRPAGLIGWFGTPFFRMFQKRFERETQATVLQQCSFAA